MVEVVEPDQNASEDHVQTRAEKDVEVFDQVEIIVCCSFIACPSKRDVRDVFVII